MIGFNEPPFLVVSGGGKYRVKKGPITQKGVCSLQWNFTLITTPYLLHTGWRRRQEKDPTNTPRQSIVMTVQNTFTTISQTPRRYCCCPDRCVPVCVLFFVSPTTNNRGFDLWPSLLRTHVSCWRFPPTEVSSESNCGESRLRSSFTSEYRNETKTQPNLNANTSLSSRCYLTFRTPWRDGKQLARPSESLPG